MTDQTYILSDITVAIQFFLIAKSRLRKNFNLNIVNKPLSIFFKEKVSFDIIIMNDVIEHLDNPFETLELIEKHLNPEGYLIFTTFNMDAIVPKIMGGRYHWIMPMHKFYFSNANLKYFLKINNMDLFKIKYDTKLTNIEYFFSKLKLCFCCMVFNGLDGFARRKKAPAGTHRLVKKL